MALWEDREKDGGKMVILNNKGNSEKRDCHENSKKNTPVSNSGISGHSPDFYNHIHYSRLVEDYRQVG